MREDYNFVIKITTNCPAHCKCCVNRKKAFENKNENNTVFNISYFEKLCSIINQIGGKYICFSGGEPTMVSNIEAYMKIAHSYGLKTRINTNGWDITAEKLDLWLSLGLEQIVLSVYSLDAENIDNVRGSSVLLERLLKSAKVIKEFKEKRDFIFIVQTVVMKDNYTELPQILEFAINNNANLMWPSYMEDAINLPGVRMEKEDINILKSNIIPKMKDIVNKYIFEEEKKKDIIYNLNEYYKNEFDGYIYHNENYECHWTQRHLTFYPNGTIYPCPAHEYFYSKCERKIDYNSIDVPQVLSILNQDTKDLQQYCKYCPKGIFQDIRIS